MTCVFIDILLSDTVLIFIFFLRSNENSLKLTKRSGTLRVQTQFQKKRAWAHDILIQHLPAIPNYKFSHRNRHIHNKHEFVSVLGSHSNKVVSTQISQAESVANCSVGLGQQVASFTNQTVVLYCVVLVIGSILFQGENQTQVERLGVKDERNKKGKALKAGFGLHLGIWRIWGGVLPNPRYAYTCQNWRYSSVCIFGIKSQ